MLSVMAYIHPLQETAPKQGCWNVLQGPGDQCPALDPAQCYHPNREINLLAQPIKQKYKKPELFTIVDILQITCGPACELACS